MFDICVVMLEYHHIISIMVIWFCLPMCCCMCCSIVILMVEFELRIFNQVSKDFLSFHQNALGFDFILMVLAKFVMVENWKVALCSFIKNIYLLSHSYDHDLGDLIAALTM